MLPPLRLDLRHYETVVAIVEFGTMTEAATHLATTQSALSHRLAEAERRVGSPLFTRGRNRRLSPTRDGLVVHQAASRALEELARTEAAVIGVSRRRPTTLRIAVGSYDCYHWFPGFLSRVHDRLPEIDLDLVVVGDAPGTALAANDVDIVLAPGRPEGDLRLEPIFEDELMLIVDASHAFAGRDRVDAPDLVGETYLTYNAQPTPGFEYDRFIRPSGVYPRLVRVVRQTSAISELVAAGVGVSILSRWAHEPLLASGRVAALRCGPGLPLLWHAATRPSDEASATVVAELVAHLG